MRWAIRRARVWHGRDGYKLAISDSAWWALAISVTYDRLMDVLGHPCCGRGIGRLDPAGALAWKLLQSTANIDWDHTSRLAELPVDEDVARALWLGDWDEWQEILSDDSDDDS
jgi:hypothetical protein